MNKLLKKSLFLFFILFLKSDFPMQGVQKLLPPSPPKTESSQVNPEEVKNVIDKTLQEASAIENEAKKSPSSLWQKFLSKFENNKMLTALGGIGATAITLMGYALVSARKEAERERTQRKFEQAERETERTNRDLQIAENKKIIEANKKAMEEANEKIEQLKQELNESKAIVGLKKTPSSQIIEAGLNQPSPKIPRARQEHLEMQRPEPKPSFGRTSPTEIDMSSYNPK